MSNEHSYERLCDYYRAKQKQKENDMTRSEHKINVGDRKEVIRFAFFPMIIESRFVFLKRYKVIKQYSRSFIWDDWDFEYNTEYYWQTTERKLIR